MRSYTWTKGSLPPEIRILQRLRREYGPLDHRACWIWPGATSGRPPHLYGQVITGSRSDGSRRARQAHVVMWEAAYGPTPAGKELHHRCMNKLCCNPTHLEPVTHRVNAVLVPEAVRQKRRDSLALARRVLAGSAT